MKKTLFKSVLVLGAVAALSGCVSREQADEKLAKACQAGISVLLPDDQTIDKIAHSEFSPATEGTTFRHVTIYATLNNDWLEEEHKYQCVFDESFGIFHTSYTAAIEKLAPGDGRVFGQAGGQILGDANDWLKITNATREAMYK